MKAKPVYKCTRCGKIVVKNEIQLDPDELSCVENISTHVCDIAFWMDEEGDEYASNDQIGIIKLVGYDEVTEC